MSEKSFTTKRKVPRFALVAEAEVAETRKRGSCLHVRISELSAGGCYVDALNSLPPSTEIQLHIKHGGVECVLPGTIIYVHEGLGMGVRFGDVPAEQRAILDGWLAEMAESSNE